jgi:hypothetical protein
MKYVILSLAALLLLWLPANTSEAAHVEVTIQRKSCRPMLFHHRFESRHERWIARPLFRSYILIERRSCSGGRCKIEIVEPPAEPTKQDTQLYNFLFDR